MSSFSVGYIMAPLLATSYFYSACGRRTTTQLSLAVLAIALLLYAFAYFIPDSLTATFTSISILLRLV